MSSERSVLIELVAVQKLQLEYSRRKQRRDFSRLRPDPAVVAEVKAMKEELDRRLPAAWAAARALVAESAAEGLPTPSSMTNTWEATVYKGDKHPEKCTTCHRGGEHMRLIASGTIECSHIECPNRKRHTAQLGDRIARGTD